MAYHSRNRLPEPGEDTKVSLKHCKLISPHDTIILWLQWHEFPKPTWSTDAQPSLTEQSLVPVMTLQQSCLCHSSQQTTGGLPVGQKQG